MREAGNAAQLKRNFAGSPLLYVPEVHWDYCRSNVMVMERIHGLVISQVEELRARGADIARLAENGVEIFFTQVFQYDVVTILALRVVGGGRGAGRLRRGARARFRDNRGGAPPSRSRTRGR